MKVYIVEGTAKTGFQVDDRWVESVWSTPEQAVKTVEDLTALYDASKHLGRKRSISFEILPMELDTVVQPES